MITYNGTYADGRFMLFTDSVTGSTFSVPSGSGLVELEAILRAVRERFAFAAAPDVEMMRCPICLTWLSYIMDSHGMVDLPVRWVVCRQCSGEEGGDAVGGDAVKELEIKSFLC